MKQNMDMAITCHDMIHDARNDMVKDAQEMSPMVTVDNVIACRHHFKIVDFWNEQMCKAMGWK